VCKGAEYGVIGGIEVIRICNHWIQTFHGSILSVHCSMWLHFEPIQLLNFYIDADPVPALFLMGIWIQLPKRDAQIRTYDVTDR
jgi:hypothetical protein